MSHKPMVHSERAIKPATIDALHRQAHQAVDKPRSLDSLDRAAERMGAIHAAPTPIPYAAKRPTQLPGSPNLPVRRPAASGPHDAISRTPDPRREPERTPPPRAVHLARGPVGPAVSQSTAPTKYGRPAGPLPGPSSPLIS